MARHLRFIPIALAGALAMSACGGSDDDSAGGGEGGGTYNVVFVSGLSGPLSSFAAPALLAVETAADAINADGGILGRQIEVEALDSGGDPTQAVTVLQDRITSGEPIDLVFSGVTSPETLAMLPVLTRNEIASFSNSSNPAIDDPESYPYHFGNVPSAAGQLAALPAYLEEQGVEKLSVLLAQDASGDGNSAAIASVLEDAGIEIVEERFNPADVDLTNAYERAYSVGADAMYVDCTGDPCGRLFDAREAVGATEQLTIGGSGVSSTAGGPSSYASPASLANLVVGVFQVQQYVAPEDRTEAFTTFFEGMTADEPLESNILAAAAAYDGLRAFALAAEEAGSTDAAEVAEAMFEIGAPDDGWIVYPDGPSFEDDSHFPRPTEAVFAYITPGPLEDGMFRPIA